MKSIMFAVSALALTGLAFAGADAPQSKPVQLAYDIAHYWVYCINEKTSVEQWDLQQMKDRSGSDVCMQHEDTSVSGAQDWMAKNFPSGTCSC